MDCNQIDKLGVGRTLDQMVAGHLVKLIPAAVSPAGRYRRPDGALYAGRASAEMFRGLRIQVFCDKFRGCSSLDHLHQNIGQVPEAGERWVDPQAKQGSVHEMLQTDAVWFGLEIGFCRHDTILSVSFGICHTTAGGPRHRGGDLAPCSINKQLRSLGMELFCFIHKIYIPTGITQNSKDLLASPEISNILENSDFIYMLNQAAGDRKILAKQLNISPHQLSYVTHSGEGEGLLFYGNVILPFVDRFPKDTELYRIMTTKPQEISG